MLSAFQEKSTACSPGRGSPDVAHRGKMNPAAGQQSHPVSILQIPPRPPLSAPPPGDAGVLGVAEHLRCAHGIPTVHMKIGCTVSPPCVQPILQLHMGQRKMRSSLPPSKLMLQKLLFYLPVLTLFSQCTRHAGWDLCHF